MTVQWVVAVLCTLSQGLRMLGRKVAVLITGVDRVGGKWYSRPGGQSPMEGNMIILTLRLLMSYIYIYGAPSKARNANVVYIWTDVWQR